MTQNRTVDEKIGDTAKAFDLLREALTTPPMRQLIVTLTTAAVPKEGATIHEIELYQQLVQSSLLLAGKIMANDRAAMLAAAIITQSGVSRPVIQMDESE